jgi:hypothetical protein
MQLSHLWQDGYTESGVGVLGQRVNSAENTYFATGLGLEFKRYLNKGSYAMRLGVKHAFSGANPRVTFGLAGGGSTVFEMRGQQDKTHVVMSIGGEAEFSPGWTVAGDAVLTFKVPASSEEQIDLLYGVLGAQYTDVEGATIGTVGQPMKNLTKQETDGKISILFKHSLAKIAIDIKDVVDAIAPTTSVLGADTKVVVEKLTVKGTIGTSGKLNLYTGAWSDTASGTSFDVTPLPSDIYSGATAPTTYPTVDGVKETGLGTGKTIDLMVVPATGAKITGVEITYYICTEDSQLDGGVSIVKNVISKDLAPAITIEQGKQYGLNVLLGLTSIKLDATVSDWDTTAGSTNVDLPKNK